MKFKTIMYAAFFATMGACAQQPRQHGDQENQASFKVQKTEEEWKNQLSEKQYYVLRQKGTERAFTGEYDKHYKNGIYHCAACNTALFGSDTKFDSGTGWPSFYDIVDEQNVKKVVDRGHGMVRTEVVCGSCGGHLGHVFNDGPRPTGLRYCINSVSLDFVPEQ